MVGHYKSKRERERTRKYIGRVKCIIRKLYSLVRSFFLFFFVFLFFRCLLRSNASQGKREDEFIASKGCFIPFRTQTQLSLSFSLSTSSIFFTSSVISFRRQTSDTQSNVKPAKCLLVHLFQCPVFIDFITLTSNYYQVTD